MLMHMNGKDMEDEAGRVVGYPRYEDGDVNMLGINRANALYGLLEPYITYIQVLNTFILIYHIKNKKMTKITLYIMHTRDNLHSSLVFLTTIDDCIHKLQTSF